MTLPTKQQRHFRLRNSQRQHNACSRLHGLVQFLLLLAAMLLVAMRVVHRHAQADNKLGLRDSSSGMFESMLHDFRRGRLSRSSEMRQPQQQNHQQVQRPEQEMEPMEEAKAPGISEGDFASIFANQRHFVADSEEEDLEDIEDQEGKQEAPPAVPIKPAQQFVPFPQKRQLGVANLAAQPAKANYDAAAAAKVQPSRDVLLPDQPLCASAIQPEPWRTKLPADLAQRPRFLQANPDCPGAEARMAPVLQNAENHHNPGKKITLTMLYYQDVQLLSRQLAAWLDWPETVRNQYDFLILDDGSQLGLRAVDLIQAARNHGPDKADIGPLLSSLTLYEIEQDLPFNMGGAHNLAHALAQTEIVLSTDADVFINGAVAAYLLEKAALLESQPDGKLVIFNFLYQLMPDRQTLEPHPAVMLTTKRAYWAVGGCDEDLVGHYGQTDILFFWKANRDAVIRVTSLTEDMKDRGIFVQKWWRWYQHNCHEDFDCPTTAKTLRPKQPRILKYNMETFADKKKRRAPFSNTFLRFSWHKVDLL